MTEVENLQHFIVKTQNFASELKGRLHLRYWYRGQADTKWLLTPKLYRMDPDKKEKLDESTILHKERHLFRDFRLMSASIRDGSESDGQLYFLAQHYGMPTRLLDWTTNPLIALYFACAEAKHQESDGEVCMLDVYKLRQSPQSSGARSGIATDRRAEFQAWMTSIFDWKDDSKKIEGTLPIRPEHFDRRISLQQGCFTFHAFKIWARGVREDKSGA
jgi:FRG domain